ncbi:MAG: (2Fe-2S) ferredoxin domain-containing protein [Actinobacteria bacterium]|nr:MAG: (2Fe-2S) ferredoxin domain-containing protein [Actinomycetota bacterium]
MRAIVARSIGLIPMKPEKDVFVCTNERPSGHPRGSCVQNGSIEVLQTFRDLQGEKNLFNFKVVATGCLEPCLAGPTVVVYPDNVWYGGVTVDDVERIIDEHLVRGRPVEFLILDEEDFERSQRGPKEAPPSCL